MKTIMICVLALFSLYACNNADKTSTEPAPPVSGDTATNSAAEKPAAPAAANPYSQELKYGNLNFVVSAPQSASGNEVTITPSGLANSNDPITVPVEGIVTKSEAADIDGDDSPELLVVSQSADKKGHAYVFSTFNKKSMGMVNLPDFTQDAKNKSVYQGMDDFALVETRFLHSFPIYENGNTTGKSRQLQYKLKAGEAMKQLVLSSTIEY